ncbi:LysM peptidoglycan-binding domain-containing protein [Flavobacterium sp. LT1R49]|uniref:LysM peptidoglycan-binding domain-containing protein n=1 Tax=Flavobacterium arabinosi TaxID=3398737 RepID=UPI003A88B166
MSLRLVVTLFLLNSIVLFSQESTKKHTIIKGETISSIAEKYDVKQSEIYKLNPKVKNLLKLNSVLLIPVTAPKNTTTKSKIATNYSEKEHEVLAKETLYGIARQYGITVKELNEANPTLETSGLKIGQKIAIPGNATSTEIAVAPPAKKSSQKVPVAIEPKIAETESTIGESTIIEVLPKETKYSITKKYGITIKEFDKANPTLGVKSLRVGQKINIPANASLKTEIAVAPQENKIQSLQEPTVMALPINDLSKAALVIVTNPTESSNTSNETIVREVLPKETKYGIAKQYGLTAHELENQNPEIKYNFPVGYKLNIRSANANNENVAIADTENGRHKFINDENDNEQYKNVESNKWEFKSFVKPASNPNFLDELIETASSNIGTRYQSGGTSKSGYDCSGLMCTTFGAFDIKLPRTSIEQSRLGVVVNAEDAQKGDLIFFKTNGRSRINHVGMVVEVCDGDIKFIHASVGGGVVISSVKEKYYEKKLTQINRVLQ